jgi:hypothetical protein
MSKLQSEQLASSSHQLRRSMTEITMPTPPSAMLEKLASVLPTAPPRLVKSRDKNLPPKVAVKSKNTKPEHAAKISKISASSLPQASLLIREGLDANVVLHVLEDVTAAAAKTAKDYRSWMFEQVKNNINAALGYASGLATTSLSARLDVFSVGREHKQRKDSGVSKPEQDVSAPEKAAAEYCSQALDLVATNVTATLEYAERLSNVKSPAEFVVLSTSHARNQVELAQLYRAALGALVKSTALTNAERLNASIAKVLTEPK